MPTPARPKLVPNDAVWSATDNEWVVAEKDAAGRYQGLVKYYRRQGSLVCTCEHLDGVPHGASTRFHETGEPSRRSTFNHGALDGLDTTFPATGHTTELCFPTSYGSNVVRYEQFWQDGLIVWRHFRDAHGQSVRVDGERYPSRPPGVPETALPSGNYWTSGAVDATGHKCGVWSTFDETGAFAGEER